MSSTPSSEESRTILTRVSMRHASVSRVATITLDSSTTTLAQLLSMMYSVFDSGCHVVVTVRLTNTQTRLLWKELLRLNLAKHVTIEAISPAST